MPKVKSSDGILGLAIGDALGLPYEFLTRDELINETIDKMLPTERLKTPKGYYSDDTSLTLCLLESLTGGYNLEDIANNFVKWLYDGYLTPEGKAFGIGKTTKESIIRIKEGVALSECGGIGERDNGNGSLMRILPLAYYLPTISHDKWYNIIREICSLTHAHDVSVIACTIYVLYAIELINGEDKFNSLVKVSETIKNDFSNNSELSRFEIVLNNEIKNQNIDNIRSGGYVVSTLEAALYCFLTTDNYNDCITTAIKLGHDTDTTAAVCGGLAGIYYKVHTINSNWIHSLKDLNKIISLCEKFDKTIKK